MYITVNQQIGSQNCNGFGYFLELYITFFFFGVGNLFDVKTQTYEEIIKLDCWKTHYYWLFIVNRSATFCSLFTEGILHSRLSLLNLNKCLAKKNTFWKSTGSYMWLLSLYMWLHSYLCSCRCQHRFPSISFPGGNHASVRGKWKHFQEQASSWKILFTV